ncbi:glycosyltransferase [Pedobacter helvus]|uniref:Glycosyltransferase 2-like domain-containing protein n=1 Tax=Pedobacter helvus TaxID=2563444 RepID=A0ABW9JCS6_9SPHI|nr:glycosyltransferase [Pedobacter ureilyticus]
MILRVKNLVYSLKYLFSSLFTNRFRIELDADLNRNDKIIVSMTSKPDRIHKVWLVVESLLRQKEMPNAVILYLALDEFRDEKILPQRLLKLKKRGLQIVFVADNLKPHNKYFYAIASFPKANIITVDDDKIYPPNLVSVLKQYAGLYPDKICSVLTREIKTKNGQVESYVNWEVIRSNREPSHTLLNLGVGGVIYPPGALHKDLFDKEQLKNRTLLTDDIWLKVMAIRNNTKIVSLAGLFRKPFVSITGLGKEQLMLKNIYGGENDLVFKDLLSWYNIDVNKFQD